MYKSYIIIGSKGLLGSEIVKILKRKNAKVIEVNKNNYNGKRNSSADILINANGNSNKFFANTYPIRDFKKSFISVYKTLNDFKYKKYIYISSGDVYSKPSIKSSNEKIEIHNPLNFYGKNKHLAETLVKYYCKNWLIFRLGPMIGSKLKKNSIFNIKNNKFVYENIHSKSTFINSKSVAKIILKVERKISNKIFNLSGKGTVTFGYLKKLINSKSNFDNKKKKATYELKINKISKHYKVPLTIKEVRKFLGHLIN
jgi:dTDP-4-dehydrorhamnose reductase